MSRVDDSDNQRIREMQEQELKARKDGERKDADMRITKSFQEVMRERTQKQVSQKASAQEQNKGKSQAKDAEKGNAAKELLKRLPKNPGDLAKRAALSRAAAQGLAGKRSTDGQKAREAENDRNDDLLKKADDEKDVREKDLREDAEADIKRADDRDTKFHKVDADQENRGERERNERQQRDRNSGDQGQGERRAEGVQAAQGPKQEAQARGIPPEVIEKIVSAIHHAATADGRTEMQIELKGTMLEGVTLKVRAERGKVSCTFEGADRDLKNLLESSKGPLMRGLEKRGLTLTAFKVV